MFGEQQPFQLIIELLFCRLIRSKFFIGKSDEIIIIANIFQIEWLHTTDADLPIIVIMHFIFEEINISFIQLIRYNFFVFLFNRSEFAA